KDESALHTIWIARAERVSVVASAGTQQDIALQASREIVGYIRRRGALHRTCIERICCVRRFPGIRVNLNGPTPRKIEYRPADPGRYSAGTNNGARIQS